MKKQVLTLMGATASGKTALAMALADQMPIELISVDSALIYKDMNIGTAKPTPAELKKYPHQLIDILDPKEIYSVAQFVSDVILLIERAFLQGKTPLLVGGTMMYFKSLIEGLSPLPHSDEAVRAQIEQMAQEKGWHFVHQQLEKIDPVSASRIHQNDPQRINRAYEVYLLTGKSLTELSQTKTTQTAYSFKQFAMESADRAQLHQQIERRFDQMLAQSFEQEVQQLMARGDLHLELPSMRSVGYRQMWQYLQGDITFDEMRFMGICATRQLAKRQITWLRGWNTPLHYVNPQNGIDKIIKEI